MEAFTFLSSLRRSQALMRLLGHRQTYLFEYFTVQDSMVIYNKDMTVWRKIEHYLGGDQSIRQGQLRPEDSWQIRELLTGSLHGPMELRGIRTQGEETVYEVDAVPSEDEAAGTIYLGYIRDITLEKAKEKKSAPAGPAGFPDPAVQQHDRQGLHRPVPAGEGPLRLLRPAGH